jgi:hypothetical protein
MNPQFEGPWSYHYRVPRWSESIRRNQNDGGGYNQDPDQKRSARAHGARHIVRMWECIQPEDTGFGALNN